MITKAKYSKLRKALEGSDAALNELDWIPGDIQKKLTVAQLAVLCYVMKSRNYEGFKDGIKRRNQFLQSIYWSIAAIKAKLV